MEIDGWPPSPTEPTHKERELLAAGDRMNRAAWRSVASWRQGAEFEDFDAFYVHADPLPTETLNGVVLTERPAQPEILLATAIRFFSSRSPRWGLTCPQHRAAEFEAPCREAGLVAGSPKPAMILDSGAEQTTAEVPGFVSRRIVDWPTLELFGQTFAKANELPDSPFWLSSALLLEPNWDLLLGFLNGEPVATGVGYSFAGITGIWGIATLPSVRGRGVGAAITAAVIAAGTLRGSRAAHLWATQLGFPVYRRMGFRHVANTAAWTYDRPP